MPDFRFHFLMPNLPVEIQKYTVFAWGGHVGTALGRAWKTLRQVDVYRGKNMSTKLRHMNIDATRLSTEHIHRVSGPGFRE